MKKKNRTLRKKAPKNKKLIFHTMAQWKMFNLIGFCKLQFPFNFPTKIQWKFNETYKQKFIPLRSSDFLQIASLNILYKNRFKLRIFVDFAKCLLKLRELFKNLNRWIAKLILPDFIERAVLFCQNFLLKNLRLNKSVRIYTFSGTSGI